MRKRRSLNCEKRLNRVGLPTLLRIFCFLSLYVVVLFNFLDSIGLHQVFDGLRYILVFVLLFLPFLGYFSGGVRDLGWEVVVASILFMTLVYNLLEGVWMLLRGGSYSELLWYGFSDEILLVINLPFFRIPVYAWVMSLSFWFRAGLIIFLILRILAGRGFSYSTEGSR